MISNAYIDGYIELAWRIVSTSPQRAPSSYTQMIKLYNHFRTKHATFLKELIINSQLSPTNLIISLYYLYKYYHQNTIISTRLEKTEGVGSNEMEVDPMHMYLIVTSIILSNKCYDDQSYTLKTWAIIINNTCKNSCAGSFNADLQLLNSMEAYFLSSLGYKISFNGITNDNSFWSLFEYKGDVVNIDETTLSMFKSLAGYSAAEIEVSTPIITQQYHEPNQQPYQQPYQQQALFVNPITPPPPLTCSCSPLYNQPQQWSSLNYPLTPAPSQYDYNYNNYQQQCYPQAKYVLPSECYATYKPLYNPLINTYTLTQLYY